MSFVNKKSVSALALSSILLSGCAGAALTATALIAGQNTGQHLALVKFKPYNRFVSTHFQFAESDIRQQSDIDNTILAESVKKGEAVQILPQGFKAFTKQDFLDFRLKRLQVKELNTATTDYYTFITLGMVDADLKEIARIAKKYQHIVMIRGLLDNSIEKTIERAGILTNQGVTVLIAPGLMQKLQAQYAPTFAQVHVQADGSYGCTEQEGSKCKPTDGHIGFAAKPLFGNIGGR